MRGLRRTRSMRALAALGLLGVPAACSTGTGTGTERSGGSAPSTDVPAPSNTRASGSPASARRYQVDAYLIAWPDRPVQLCSDVAQSLPPHCGGGVQALGVDLASVPGGRQRGGVTYTDEPVRWIGTWDGTALTVDRTDVVPSRPVPTIDDPPPCTPPVNDWIGAPVGSTRVQEAIQPYLDAHADTFGIAWWDEADQTLTLGFADDPGNHEPAIRAIAPRTCVVRVAISRNAATQLRDEVLSSSTANDIQVLSAGGNPRTGQVSLWVAIHDERTERWRKEHFPDTVVIAGALVVPYEG